MYGTKLYFMWDSPRHPSFDMQLRPSRLSAETHRTLRVAHCGLLSCRVVENFLAGGPQGNPLEINEVYDLKGSWVDRNAAATPPGTVTRCKVDPPLPNAPCVTVYAVHDRAFRGFHLTPPLA